MCENTSCATEIRNLKTALEDAQASLSGAQHALKWEQESASRVESQYYEAKTSLNRDRDIFETIWTRDDINLDEDSLFKDLADLLGFENTVEVWVTVKAEWSQKVSLPRGYDESKVNITTDVQDYLTVTYDDCELSEELSQDQFEVEVSE